MSRFDTLINRRGTGCYKYDALPMMYGRDDLIPLWVADMDFAVSDQVKAAIAKRAEHPLYGYNLRLPAFEEVLVNWLAKRHGWHTESHAQAVFPSLMTALAVSILSLTKAGDNIMIQTPVYPPFHSLVTNHGRNLLRNPLLYQDGVWNIDWPDFERKAAQSRLFILCNPHNPVGRVFRADELRRMAEICTKHGVIIFSDDIHSDLVYPGHRHIPMATLAEELTITGISPAKSFNLAGMGTAVILSKNQDLIARCQELNKDLHTFMGNCFGISAWQAAYGESEEWFDELLRYLKGNRDCLLSELPMVLPETRISPIEGTFLAWLDFRAYGLSEAELIHKLRDDCRLALNAGSAFGSDGEGFMRLNFACPRSVLVEALQRLRAF